MTKTRIFDHSDVDVRVLHNKRVAIIGFGSQGHAHAQNLRDSGVEVVVGVRPDGRSAQQAREAGFAPQSVADATRSAELVAILIPDTAQATVYAQDIAPDLRPGAALLFAHGFNIHYRQILPPPDSDVVLVAPKSPGHMLRREYRAGHGVPSLVGVHQDASGNALALALAYAHGLGSMRAGVLETTFADETESDLFGEQAVLCGGLTSLIQAGFETLTEAGYPPELAYFECLHEMKLIVDLVYQGGLQGMRARVSDTAEYGDYVSGNRVVGEASRAAMRELLQDIRSGAFAERWVREARQGGKDFQRMRKQGAEHPIEEVGERLRSRMVWLQEA